MSLGHVLCGEPTRPNGLVSMICDIRVGHGTTAAAAAFLGGVKMTTDIKREKREQPESIELLGNYKASGFHRKAVLSLLYMRSALSNSNFRRT